MPIEVQNDPNVFYSTEEVAKKLDLKSTLTVLRYIRDEKLKAKKVGKGYRIAASALHSFITKRN